MGALRIIEPGLFSTVQDLGRPGWGSLGVPRGGAADSLSLRLGNRLVGNADGAGAIEMTLNGIACEFEDERVIAVEGARVSAVIEGRTGTSRVFRSGAHERVLAGEILRIGRFESGCRAYLCVAGGVVVAPKFGSASTLASTGFGGHEGRALRAGDRLVTGEPSGNPTCPNNRQRALIDEILDRRVVRATAGAQFASFPRRAAEVFWSSSFAVTEQSDRVGIRLNGPSLAGVGDGRMISEGMMPGAVQVPGDGKPIVLMCDHPTTGGYPVIACVASADIPVLGQLRPRESIRFELIAIERAWELLDDRFGAMGSGAGA